MQIRASDLSLSGSSTRLFHHERSERLEMWTGQRPQRQRILALPGIFFIP